MKTLQFSRGLSLVSTALSLFYFCFLCLPSSAVGVDSTNGERSLIEPDSNPLNKRDDDNFIPSELFSSDDQHGLRKRSRTIRRKKTLFPISPLHPKEPKTIISTTVKTTTHATTSATFELPAAAATTTLHPNLGRTLSSTAKTAVITKAAVEPPKKLQTVKVNKGKRRRGKPKKGRKGGRRKGKGKGRRRGKPKGKGRRGKGRKGKGRKGPAPAPVVKIPSTTTTKTISPPRVSATGSTISNN